MRTVYIETALDTLSFFFVTTDLYGKTNLTTLDCRLSESLRAARSLKFDRIFWVVFGALFIILIALLYKLYVSHSDWFQSHAALVAALVQDFLPLSIISLAFISAVSTLIVLFIFSAVIKLSLTLLEKLSLHGVLISVGTLLFLAARAASILETLRS
jgi:hypothetical protein